MSNSRPSWDDYFISLMHEVGQRGTCDRGKSGCIIVRDNRILTTGYVGSSPGMPHCDEAGHLIKKVMDENGKMKEHCVRTIHAEQNAICQAARHGISIKDATLYCKMEPCRTCAQMIIAVGISRVVAYRRYHAAQDTRNLFQNAGVAMTVIKDEIETYPT